MNSRFKCLFCATAILSIIYSCDPPKNKESAETGVEKPEIENVALYLETSASMAGYFQKDAEFKTIVSDLSAKIDNNIHPLSIWFIADSTIKYPNKVSQFSTDIATTKIATQKSSQIHRIIEEIGAKTDSTTISIFVSDCIMSFPDEDIKKNPEINKHEAPNALKNNIFTTASDLKKRGLGVSIYLFTSKFYGTYFNYQNGKKQLNGDRRPFYVWVIGSADILDDFTNKLQNISTFHPEKELHFGASTEEVSDYDIFTQIEKEGDWIKSGQRAIGEIEEGDKFCVGLSLAGLPFYARDQEYIKENLQVECQGCTLSFEVNEKAGLSQRPSSNSQLASFEKDSHFLTFTVDEMPLKEVTAKFSLPLKYDRWYIDNSTDDDRNMGELANKTFAFQYLINGVMEAYTTNSSYFINSGIQLKK